MNKIISELTKKYGHVGSYVLLTPKSFSVFGNETNDDMVVLGKCKYLRSELVINSEITEAKDKDLKFLISKVESLTETSAYASFQLTGDAIKQIKNCINKIDATHLRIHTIGNSVRVSIFDCRKYLDNSRIQGKLLRVFVTMILIMQTLVLISQ
jgi:hypothetical protein